MGSPQGGPLALEVLGHALPRRQGAVLPLPVLYRLRGALQVPSKTRDGFAGRQGGKCHGTAEKEGELDDFAGQFHLFFLILFKF